MKLRVVILIVLTLTTVSTAYVSGRWNWFVIIPPVIIPACLMLITSLLVICPRHGDASAWNQRLVRFSALALCWLVALLPSLMGDGYFEMGRRAHIRSLFSPELVAEVRAAASKLSTKKTEFGSVRLSDGDLPKAIGDSPSRFPGYASCTFDAQGELSSVFLIWGGALVSHHGLLITDKQIPFYGHPTHSTDDRGQVVAEYYQRYYPLYPGSYILIDEH